MLTIDASVWVNADSPAEPDSTFSRVFLDKVAFTQTLVIVPTLLRVEVAAAIGRTRRDATLAQEFAEKLTALPFVQWISLDAALAARASKLAGDQGLRGADAVYAAVALANRYELISLDHEHLTRSAKVVQVRSPAQFLASSITT